MSQQRVKPATVAVFCWKALALNIYLDVPLTKFLCLMLLMSGANFNNCQSMLNILDNNLYQLMFTVMFPCDVSISRLLKVDRYILVTFMKREYVSLY